MRRAAFEGLEKVLDDGGGVGVVLLSGRWVTVWVRFSQRCIPRAFVMAGRYNQGLQGYQAREVDEIARDSGRARLHAPSVEPKWIHVKPACQRLVPALTRPRKSPLAQATP